MNLKLIGIALVASIGLAQSRTETTSTPKFEVTSVKPNKSPDFSKGGLQFLPGGRFIATNIPLIQVIAAAWNLPLQSQRLTLGSGVKMPDDIYDIEATAQKGTFPPGLTTEARLLKMRLRLQALLEDRFKLRVRGEPKEQPVYALVVGKGGPKLTAVRDMSFEFPAKALRRERLIGFLRFFDLNFFWRKMTPEGG